MFDGLIPLLRPAAEWTFRQCEVWGLHPRVTSVFRTQAQQQALYDRYLRGQNAYPVLPPGRSLHGLGLAFDMVCDKPEWAGYAWRSMGGTWGGRTDPVHFEWKPKGMKWNRTENDWSIPVKVGDYNFHAAVIQHMGVMGY